uniref:Uncharacterized protein n=1 Tax=Sphaerodactylus townsendi TaxID=933632 RepID=A0ACB8EMJ9_9SAUR
MAPAELSTCRLPQPDNPPACPLVFTCCSGRFHPGSLRGRPKVVFLQQVPPGEVVEHSGHHLQLDRRAILQEQVGHLHPGHVVQFPARDAAGLVGDFRQQEHKHAQVLVRQVLQDTQQGPVGHVAGEEKAPASKGRKAMGAAEQRKGLARVCAGGVALSLSDAFAAGEEEGELLPAAKSVCTRVSAASASPKVRTSRPEGERVRQRERELGA